MGVTPSVRHPYGTPALGVLMWSWDCERGHREALHWETGLLGELPLHGIL